MGALPDDTSSSADTARLLPGDAAPPLHASSSAPPSSSHAPTQPPPIASMGQPCSAPAYGHPIGNPPAYGTPPPYGYPPSIHAAAAGHGAVPPPAPVTVTLPAGAVQMPAFSTVPFPGLKMLEPRVDPLPGQVVIGYELSRPEVGCFVCDTLNAQGWLAVIVLSILSWPLALVPCLIPEFHDPCQRPVFGDPIHLQQQPVQQQASYFVPPETYHQQLSSKN